MIRSIVRRALERALLAVALVVLVGTAGAQAQDSGDGSQQQAEARAVLQQAQRLYEDGQYALAAERYLEFRQRLIALGNERAPLALWNAGLSLSHIPGREADALDTLERFINDSHVLNDDPEVRDMRSEAQVKIAELRQRLGQSPEVHSTSSGGVNVWVPGIIIASVGGAAAIAGGAIGGVALSSSGDATSGCAGTTCPAGTDTNAIDDAYLLANVADGLLFGGLGVAAVGLVLTFVVQDGGGDSASAGMMCTASGCAATVTGRF